MTPREFIDWFLRGRHRLESIELLPLGATYGDAVALYGPPLSSEPAEESPEIQCHTFQAGPYHQALTSEWQGRIQLITYWSRKADPARDLVRYLEFHSDGMTWNPIETGSVFSWFQRSDGQRRLWCSAVPGIGVAYVDFLKARTELKTARQVQELSSLKDPTWAPDEAIFDLQRRFVTKEDELLLELVRRSERIAASPDGRDLIIVRDHHANDDRDGWGEVNDPPNLATGYSTQVLNFFHWAEVGSHWWKIPLPRDAVVENVRCDGAVWTVTIRQTTSEKSLTFFGSHREIGNLGEDFRFLSPHKDEDMWIALEKVHRDRNG